MSLGSFSGPPLGLNGSTSCSSLSGVPFWKCSDTGDSWCSTKKEPIALATRVIRGNKSIVGNGLGSFSIIVTSYPPYRGTLELLLLSCPDTGWHTLDVPSSNTVGDQRDVVT